MTEEQQQLIDSIDDDRVQQASELPSTLETIATIEVQEKAFELARRKAIAMSRCTFVPKEYIGDDGIANCMVALNMAERMQADPLMIAQNLHVIHGKPGWSAQFLIGCFNSCGRFTAIRYRFNDAGDACTATTTEKATGELIEGTTITMDMAEAEGWTKKAGSKWKTMPEQMLKYRSATFLIRATSPEIGLGLYTQDELSDIQ